MHRFELCLSEKLSTNELLRETWFESWCGTLLIYDLVAWTRVPILRSNRAVSSLFLKGRDGCILKHTMQSLWMACGRHASVNLHEL